MPLVTVADYEAAFGRDELLQTAGLGGSNTPDGQVVDTARVNAALEIGEDFARGTAGQRYPGVFRGEAALPRAIRQAILDIARYRLRDKSGGLGQVSETVQKRYETARADLKAMMRGDLALDLDADDDAEPVRRTVFADVPQRHHTVLEGYR